MKHCDHTFISVMKSEHTQDSPKAEEDAGCALLVHGETLSCFEGGCVACMYKIYPSGYVGDRKLPPNVRPEMCPRSTQQISTWTYYRSHHNILTLGDGDLSFSHALSTLLKEQIPRSVTVSNLVATTHESKARLLEVYPQFSDILLQLDEKGVDVRHEVDATNLAPSLPHKKYTNHFDFIAWNFPCIRMPRGADGQVEELETNKQLLRYFFENCAYLLKNGKGDSEVGEIHLTHKTIEPFSWWGIEDIAKECGFKCVAKVVFDKYLFPGYVNKKVLDNKSFPLHDARTYIFTLLSANANGTTERDVRLQDVDSTPTAERLTVAVGKILGSQSTSKLKHKTATKRPVAEDINSHEHRHKKSRHTSR